MAFSGGKLMTNCPTAATGVGVGVAASVGVGVGVGVGVAVGATAVGLPWAEDMPAMAVAVAIAPVMRAVAVVRARSTFWAETVDWVLTCACFVSTAADAVDTAIAVA